MEHYFPRDLITTSTTMAIAHMPASNDNNVNAGQENTNKTSWPLKFINVKAKHSSELC